MSALIPIAPGLWTVEAEPQLIGGRRADGAIVFPLPEGDAGAEYEPVFLHRQGILWSWTRQEFMPKSPYDGPEPFEPFLLGYVELPDQLIVQTRIVDAAPKDLEIGQPMTLVIVPFDNARSMFAFRPENGK